MGSVSVAGRGAILACALLLVSPVAAQESITDKLGGWLGFGKSSTPPPGGNNPAGPAVEVDCPSVAVRQGAATLAITLPGTEAGPMTTRYQASLGQMARECAALGGMMTMKVGVEGRVLLGPAGAAGRFDAPVTFVIKRGDSILATRTQRVSVAVPAGDTQASFVTVQDGLVVPAKAGEYEIDVGLVAGAGGAKPERAAKRKRG